MLSGVDLAFVTPPKGIPRLPQTNVPVPSANAVTYPTEADSDELPTSSRLEPSAEPLLAGPDTSLQRGEAEAQSAPLASTSEVSC